MALIPRIQWFQLIMINEAVINSFNSLVTYFLFLIDSDVYRLSFLYLHFFSFYWACFLYDIVSYIKI